MRSFEDSWTTQLLCSAQAQPSCLLWVPKRQAYDNTACTPINWTTTNTTCACGMAVFDAATAGGGSVTSGSLTMLLYFGSVFSVPVNGALFLKNTALLITFGCVGGFVLLNALIGEWRDRRDRALAAADEAAEVREDAVAAVAAHNDDNRAHTFDKPKPRLAVVMKQAMPPGGGRATRDVRVLRHAFKVIKPESLCRTAVVLGH